jgi:tetratricopeptide (TPR) repeat protein
MNCKKLLVVLIVMMPILSTAQVPKRLKNWKKYLPVIICYLDQSFQPSIDSLTNEIRRNPRNAGAYASRSVVIGDIRRRFKDISKAIELDPGNPDYYVYRAMTWYSCKEYIYAVYDCQTAIAIDKQNSFAYSMMGMAYQNLGNTEEACLCYKKAKELGYGLNNFDGTIKTLCE